MPQVKPAYARTRVVTEIPEDTKTRAVQSEAKHTDINNIVAKAYKTGQLPLLMNRQPILNLPDAMTYQDMLNKVVFAQQAFERLPSNIRAEFGNKPENMLKAIEQSKDNEGIAKQLQELGIIETPAPTEAAPSAPTTLATEPPPSAEGGK